MDDTTSTTTTKTTRCRRRGRLIATGLGLVALAAAGIAWAAGVTPAAVGRRFGHGAHARDFVEFRIHRELTAVGASDAQEQQILAMVDTLFARHQAHQALHQEMHARVQAALTADTVDRAALEAVRADALRRLDDGSRELVQAIADMAEVLTPAQRQALAARHQEEFQ